MSNSIDFLSAVSISAVWAALGGPEIRRKRSKAFWREGDGLSISIDSDRNIWYDHRDGCGGGVLALIETVQGCDRAAAIEWARDFAGVPRQEWTREQKRDWARRKSAALREADELVLWRQQAIATLQHYHNLHLRLAHICIRRIIHGNSTDEELGALMDTADMAEAAWQGAEAALDAWRAASWTDVLLAFRASRRAA